MARPTDATKPSTRSFENVRRTDNQVKNRFNSTLRRVLAAGARVGSAPSAPSAKRRRLSERDSPSSPGKSANSCETRAVAESGSENNAVVGLEQLVAAIDAHGEHLHASGEMAGRQRKIAEMRVLKMAQDIVRDRIEAGRDGHLAPLMERTAAREIDPQAAAHELLCDLKLDF